MAMSRMVASVLLCAVALAGCAVQALPEARMVVDGVSSGECIIHPTPGPGPFLQCPIAVDLAVGKLGVLTGTPSTVEFHLGFLCPPNARCMASTDQGAVVFWFGAAPPVMVRIIPDGSGGFVAQSPESPPQWLIDQGPVGQPAS